MEIIHHHPSILLPNQPTFHKSIHLLYPLYPVQGCFLRFLKGQNTATLMEYSSRLDYTIIFVSGFNCYVLFNMWFCIRRCLCEKKNPHITTGSFNFQMCPRLTGYGHGHLGSMSICCFAFMIAAKYSQCSERQQLISLLSVSVCCCAGRAPCQQ